MNSKKLLNNIIYPIIVIILIGGYFIFVFNKFTQNEEMNWDKLSKEITIGEVTGRSENVKRSSNLAYIVNGKKYDKHLDQFYLKGEKLKVQYEIKNPENSKILKAEPLFIEGETTKQTIGKLITYNSKIFSTIKYKYWVQGKYYERYQYPKENSIQIYPNVKEEQLYIIEYLEKDPRKSIIHLENPLKYKSEWWNLKLDINGKVINTDYIND